MPPKLSLDTNSGPFPNCLQVFDLGIFFEDVMIVPNNLATGEKKNHKSLANFFLVKLIACPFTLCVFQKETCVNKSKSVGSHI